MGKGTLSASANEGNSALKPLIANPGNPHIPFLSGIRDCGL